MAIEAKLGESISFLTDQSDHSTHSGQTNREGSESTCSTQANQWGRIFHGMLQNNRANKSIQITLSPFSPGSPMFPATPWRVDTKQTNDTQKNTH